jgi:hypothetical protein
MSHAFQLVQVELSVLIRNPSEGVKKSKSRPKIELARQDGSEKRAILKGPKNEETIYLHLPRGYPGPIGLLAVDHSR